MKARAFSYFVSALALASALVSTGARAMNTPQECLALLAERIEKLELNLSTRYELRDRFASSAQSSLKVAAQLAWKGVIEGLTSQIAQTRLKALDLERDQTVSDGQFQVIIRHGHGPNPSLGIYLSGVGAVMSTHMLDLGFEVTEGGKLVFSISGLANGISWPVGYAKMEGILEKLNESFEFRAGPFELNTGIHKLQVSDLDAFSEFVFDPTRAVPILYLPPSFGAAEREALAKSIYDSVSKKISPMLVVMAADAEAYSLIEAVMPQNTISKNDAIRMYFPGVKRKSSTDEERALAPFFSSTKHKFDLNVIQKDVIQKGREAHKHYLTIKKLDISVPSKVVELLEAERDVLESSKRLPEVQARLKEVTGQLEQLKKERDHIARERDAALGARDAALKERDAQIAEAAQVKKSKEVLEQELGIERQARQALDLSLEQMRRDFQKARSVSGPETPAPPVIEAEPTDLREALNWAEKLWPERLSFTEKARRHARDAKIQDARAAMRLIRVVAQNLYEMIFISNDKSGHLAKEFYAQTGIKLALSETKGTNQTPELAKMRQDVFEGQAIDISPHVKLRTHTGQMRLYFHVDHVKKRIIVGHLGDHLETAADR